MGHGWGSEDPHPPIPVGRWVAGFLRKLADWIDPPDKFMEDLKVEIRSEWQRSERIIRGLDPDGKDDQTYFHPPF